MMNNQPLGVLPTREQVFGEVRQIVAESSGLAPDEIRDGSMRLVDLPWDSLDQVECAMEIEEHFSVSVPDEMMEEAKTVGDIADGVLTILAQSQAAN